MSRAQGASTALQWKCSAEPRDGFVPAKMVAPRSAGIRTWLQVVVVWSVERSHGRLRL
jgi:hypothetical protein